MEFTSTLFLKMIYDEFILKVQNQEIPRELSSKSNEKITVK